MASKIVFSLAFAFASIALVSGERIYTPPTFQQRNPSPTPPSYASVVNPNRNVGPPKSNLNPVILQSTPRPIQGTGQFLPQNLTFVLSVRSLKRNTVDPVVKVSKSGKPGTFDALGKTESLDNNANPDFLKVFSIIWNRGTHQKLKLEVRDVDNFRRDDPLGQVTIDLDEYVARGEKWNLTLQNGTGNILIHKTEPVKFRLYARMLPNEDTVGHSDPYVECYWHVKRDGKKIKFAQTKTLDNTENPDWNETFEFGNYMRGTQQFWTFKVLDSDPTGADDLGEATVDVDSFVANRQTVITSLKRAKKTNNVNTKIGITPA